jgi:hypothetical protein
MNDMLFRTLLKRYEAVIEDALYKIQSFNENNIIIPEHIDITGEVDKLLLIIAEAEDKVAVMRKYYVKNKAETTSIVIKLPQCVAQKTHHNDSVYVW